MLDEHKEAEQAVNLVVDKLCSMFQYNRYPAERLHQPKESTKGEDIIEAHNGDVFGARPGRS